MVLTSLVLAEDWLPHLLFGAEVRFFSRYELKDGNT